MTNIWGLLEKCHDLGATLIPLEDKLKIQAPQPLPDDIMSELKESKVKVLEELQLRQKTATGCWFLEEWRRVSIPDWRRILKESIQADNEKREKYARWMLQDVLDDPDYQEPQL